MTGSLLLTTEVSSSCTFESSNLLFLLLCLSSDSAVSHGKSLRSKAIIQFLLCLYTSLLESSLINNMFKRADESHFTILFTTY